MHNVESIAVAVVPIFLELGMVSKLGFFTTDDATVNDLTIRPVLTKLHPGILQPEKRRVRCLCHISIQLRKLFSLPEIANRLRKCSLSALSPISVVEAGLAFRRKREPLEKLHNITTFIRRTPQRREGFQS